MKSWSRAAPLFLTTVMFVLFWGALTEAQAPEEPAKRAADVTEFYCDFRNKKSLDEHFQLFGPNAINCVRPEPEGLRIILPPEHTPSGRVGVIANFELKGDFEVTVGYEIVNIERPQEPKRVGINVTLRKKTNRGVLSFYRMFLGNGQDVYRSSLDEGKDATRRLSDYVPTGGGRTGQMRISRRGPTALLSVAEPAGGEFRELHRWEPGADEIDQLIIGATLLNSGGGSLVDVRVIDFRLKSTVLNTIQPEGGISPPNRKSLWLAGGLLLASFGIGAGLWIWWRRKSHGGKSPTLRVTILRPRGAEDTPRKQSEMVGCMRGHSSILPAVTLAAAIFACSIYANLSFAITDVASFKYFPPFRRRHRCQRQ